MLLSLTRTDVLQMVTFQPARPLRRVLRVCGFLLIAVLARVGECAAADLGPQGAAGTRLPGKFVWFELVTDDLAAAAAFYQAVFGWTLRPIPGAPASYTLIENGAERVAGMFEHARPAGATRSARWLALISVTDVAAAAAYATSHGGGVVSPPRARDASGVRALLRDPDGGVFGVLHVPGGDPPDTPVPDGDFFWVDLLSSDPGRAADFYSGLAGYEVSPRDSGAGFVRFVLQSQGYARAGIVPLPQTVKRTGWLPYVLVQDVQATLDRVVAAQGTVLVKPEARLLDGNLAIIADPLGGVLGILDWDALTSKVPEGGR